MALASERREMLEINEERSVIGTQERENSPQGSGIGGCVREGGEKRIRTGRTRVLFSFTPALLGHTPCLACCYSGIVPLTITKEQHAERNFSFYTYTVNYYYHYHITRIQYHGVVYFELVTSHVFFSNHKSTILVCKYSLFIVGKSD